MVVVADDPIKKGIVKWQTRYMLLRQLALQLAINEYKNIVTYNVELNL